MLMKEEHRKVVAPLIEFVYKLNDKYESFKFEPVLVERGRISEECFGSYCKVMNAYKLREIKRVRLNISVEKRIIDYSKKSKLSPYYSRAVKKGSLKLKEELRHYLYLQQEFDAFYSSIPPGEKETLEGLEWDWLKEEASVPLCLGCSLIYMKVKEEMQTRASAPNPLRLSFMRTARKGRQDFDHI